MRVFLHICCAPCAAGVIERLTAEGHMLFGFFYNPNIYPGEEYERRANSLRGFLAKINLDYAVSPYDTENWRTRVQGLEDEPENGERCKICYEMRLDHAAQTAKARGHECFATTLTISPHKSALVINPIGRRVGERHGIEFLDLDFKKQGGFHRSVLLSKEYGLYRQSYCGCEYSMKRHGSNPNNKIRMSNEIPMPNVKRHGPTQQDTTLTT